MKKIIVFITSLVLCFSLCCITVFGVSGETVNFGDYASISYMNFYKLTAGENGDYIRWVTSDTENNLYETAVQATDYGEGTITYDRFYFYVYLKAPSVNDSSTLSNIGSKNCPFYSDYYISARIRFKATGFDEDTFRSSVVMRHSYSQGTFNWESMPTVGNLQIISQGDTYTEYEAVISYKNNGSTITNFSCQFMFCFLNSEQTVLYDKIVIYEPYIYDYYYGKGDDPSIPSYTNPNDSVGGSVDDYKQQEESIMGDTEEGRESTISLFSGLGDLVDLVATPIMAISAGVSYFVGDSIINSILLISLTLGLLSFVFNIVPSYQAKQRRDAAAELREQRRDAAAELRKQYKKGGSG